MVYRYISKCLSCNRNFVFRITVGSSRNNKFRFNCPYCNLEIHGELFLNFRNNDGSTNSIEKSVPEIHLTNADLHQRFDKNEKYKYVTIFTDLPILFNKHIADTESALMTPTFQAMFELKNNAVTVIQGLNRFNELSENDFYLIKNAYLQYKNNDLERAKEILDKITYELPYDVSRIPSICSRCYQIYFSGLLGCWSKLNEHINLFEEVAKKHCKKIFDVPKQIQQFNIIEFLINEFFDLANQIFDCKEILSVARYLDFIDLDKSPRHFIALDYPDKFFNLYEQLCEYAHNLIKIEIGYINICQRGNIDLFKDSKFSNYKKYFNNAKLFDSLDLINEIKSLGDNLNYAIDRAVRNGIAHKKIAFSNDGQEIIVRRGNNVQNIKFDLILKKTIELCRICISGFGIITDQKRMITDEYWNKKNI